MESLEVFAHVNTFIYLNEVRTVDVQLCQPNNTLPDSNPEDMLFLSVILLQCQDSVHPGIQWQTVRDTWGRSQKNDYLISTCHRGLSPGCTRCTKTSYAFLNASLTRVMQITGGQVTTSAKNKNSKASCLCVARRKCRLLSSQTLSSQKVSATQVVCICSCSVKIIHNVITQLCSDS